jgi:hypothetical protein
MDGAASEPDPSTAPPDFTAVVRHLVHELNNALGTASIRASFVAAQLKEAEEGGHTDWQQARTDVAGIISEVAAAAQIARDLAQEASKQEQHPA